MAVFQRDNLPICFPGFEHINRYFDITNNIFTAKILPGQYYVGKHGEMVTTVLGSCISACIRDPIAKVGGMNHFMLPIDRRAKERGDVIDKDAASRYGDFAMEMLVNAILTSGGKRKNLEVKLFGGGNVISQIKTTDVGKMNIDFAHEYLEYEGFNVVSEDVGDIYPRKVNYFPDTGKVMMKKIKRTNNDTISTREAKYYSNILTTSDDSSELEVFTKS